MCIAKRKHACTYTWTKRKTGENIKHITQYIGHFNLCIESITYHKSNKRPIETDTNVIYKVRVPAGHAPYRGLHMGPNNLRCRTSLFIFSLCPHVTFYKTLTSLSTAFITGHVAFLQWLKWPSHTSVFTHVEPNTV